MNQIIIPKKTILLATLFISISTFSQTITKDWRLVTPKYKTAEAFVSALNVMDYNADPTGTTDQTVLFQRLLDALGSRTINAGRMSDGTPNGGILYIPEGRYLLRGTLTIPKGVTIRGDWEKPVKGQPIKGTILMSANPNARGNDATVLPNGTPGTAYESLSTIVMQPSSAIRDLNIWYPDQSADNIVPYPPAILFGQQGYWGNDYCLASNITLVNAFDGVIFSRRTGGGAPNCYGIYGTPLRRGIEIDNIAEIGRVDNIDFSADYWAGSGLPGSPSINGAHKQYIKENGTAVVMRRNDWSFIGKVKAEGYNIGYQLDLSYNPDVNGNKTAPNGHNYGMEFTDCKYGVYVAAVSGSGMMFYDYKFNNCDYGFYNAPNAGGIIQIQGCFFDTKTASVYAPLDNNTKILMNQNTINKGPVDVRGGIVSIMNCDFNNTPDQIVLGLNARSVITGNRFKEPASIKDASLYCPVVDHTPIEMSKLPQFPYKNQYDFVQKPTRHAFYLATSMGVSENSDDNSATLQAALNQASNEGGGVIFLPPGHYKFRQPITIPTGVELKGSVDVPTLPTGPGTAMEIYAGKGDEDGTPFITMEPESGIRGLVMNYPDQKVQLLTDASLNNLDVYHYPYTIRGNRDVYIVNIAFRTSYRGIDLFTNKCDNHFVDYAAGHVFRTGIRVGGGSDGGHIYNSQFNQIAYGSGGETKFGAWPNSPDNNNPNQAEYKNEHAMAYAYCWNHLDFMVFENCTNQVLYNNFDFGSNRGFVLGENANGISLGQGIDQGMQAFYLDGVGLNGFDFINTQIVTTAPSPGVNQSYRDNNRYFQVSSKFNGKVTFFGSDFWGQPQNISNEILSGTLELQSANYANSGQRSFASVAPGAALSLIGSNVNNISSLLTSGSAPQFSAQSSIINPGNTNTNDCALWSNNLTQSAPPTPCSSISRNGWIASASIYNENAQSALDGNTTTLWSSVGDRQKPGQWFMVNMIVPQSFNTVILDAGNASNRPVNCTVSVSNDGATWTDIPSTTSTASSATIITFETQEVQYIRINQTGTSTAAWRVAEFYIKDTDLGTSTSRIDSSTEIGLWFDNAGNLHLENTNGTSIVFLYTLSGQNVASSIKMENTTTVNIPRGIYIATVNNNGKMYRKKIVK